MNATIRANLDTFNRCEAKAHEVIDVIGNITIKIIKVIVTLILLGGFATYTIATLIWKFANEFADTESVNAAKELANNLRNGNVNNSNDIDDDTEGRESQASKPTTYLRVPRNLSVLNQRAADFQGTS